MSYAPNNFSYTNLPLLPNYTQSQRSDNSDATTLSAQQAVPEPPAYLLVICSVLYVLIFVVGVVGNFAVIYVIRRCRTMRTFINFLFLNLCITVLFIEMHTREVWRLVSVNYPELPTPEAIAIEVVAQADQLYKDHQFEEQVTYLKQYASLDNDEVLWRLARALNDLSKLTDVKSDQKQLIFEAFCHVSRAIEINDRNFACHKWYAILLDKTSEFDGTKKRISNAIVCKEHFLKAHELNPNDATTLYSIGVWCFLFADMSWYQRKIASALFATPPTSTYSEALKYFHKAEEVDPNFYSKNLLMLGKVYLRLDNKKLAMMYLTRACEFTSSLTDDMEARKEAEALLKQMGIKL